MAKEPQSRIEEFIRLCEQQDYFQDQKLIVDELIQDGTVNQCWVIRSGENKYLARLGRELPENLFTDWQKEIKINQFSAQLGLSAEAIFVDEPNLSALYPWCGEPLKPEDITDIAISQLGEKLGLLHVTDSPTSAIGYRQTIESYLHLIEEKSGAEIALPFVTELLELAGLWDQSTEKCFCHHDLHPGNVLWDGNSCTLIDWEYSRLAHPLFDLASLSYYFQLSDPQLSLLLKSYKGSPYTTKQIRAAEHMVVGLEKLWYTATKFTLKN